MLRSFTDQVVAWRKKVDPGADDVNGMRNWGECQSAVLPDQTAMIEIGSDAQQQISTAAMAKLSHALHLPTNSSDAILKSTANLRQSRAMHINR